MDVFASPKLLLSASKANLDEFEAACKEATSKGEGRRVIEKDANTGFQYVKIVFAGLFPDRIGYLAHTIINDLRHALDQTACVAVEALTSVEQDLLYFPICTNANDLSGRLNKAFPIQLHDALKAIAPYPTAEGSQAGNDAICLLGKAAQRKHRIVCKAAGEIVSTKINKMRVAATELAIPMPKWDPVKDEVVIARFGREGGEVSYDINLAFFVTLRGAGPIDGKPAVPLLRSFVSAVQDAVDRIEADTLKAIGT